MVISPYYQSESLRYTTRDKNKKSLLLLLRNRVSTLDD